MVRVIRRRDCARSGSGVWEQSCKVILLLPHHKGIARTVSYICAHEAAASVFCSAPTCLVAAKGQCANDLLTLASHALRTRPLILMNCLSSRSTDTMSSSLVFASLFQQPSGVDQVWSGALGDAWVHGRQSKDAAHTRIRQHHPFRGAVYRLRYCRFGRLYKHPRRACSLGYSLTHSLVTSILHVDVKACQHG